MNRNWSQSSAIPGSVKPVYGARYPPLQPQAFSGVDSSNPRASEATFEASKIGLKFNEYKDSVSDVWDADVYVDRNAACQSATQVLQRHAAAAQQHQRTANTIMPPLNPPTPSKNSKVQAMQRLATQRGAVAATAPQSGSTSLYPRLPEFSGHVTAPPIRSSLYAAASVTTSAAIDRDVSAATAVENAARDQSRFLRLHAQLSSAKNAGTKTEQQANIDIDRLRNDCWMGIPHKLRPNAWRVLSGYLPTNVERRDVTLSRKREEYWHYVEQYFHTRHDDQHQDTFRQIHIDIPRMCPLISFFQQKIVQEIFERILYIWAIRHPASGYVQGINDLVTPFFVVFLSEFIADDVEVGTFDVSKIPREEIEIVEADSFWCVSALLDTIQDNYTFAQPGIQRKVAQLRHLMCRVDRNLHNHLEKHNVEYLQFAFRWMNNLLMREIPLRATIRLWDTYLSERNGFADFHGYVCAAFLRIWSKQLQTEKDFQGIMLLLQALPTQHWADQQICELTADAFSLMSLFDGAKMHLVET